MQTLRRQASKIFSKTPAKHTPADNSNDTTSIPDSILAFRTITTMLSHIYRAKTFSDTVRSPDRALRQELKILNALATIMVRENEVVAVVAKPPDGSGMTEVIACTHLSEGETLTSPKLEGTWWNFLATPNVRRSGPSTPPGDSLYPGDDVRDPTIIHTALGIPSQLEGDNNLYEEYIRTLWGKETFNNHAWILSKLIDQSKTNAAPLQRYVVAACIRKISNRMNNVKLSKPFVNRLFNVKTFTFPELPKVAPNATEASYDDPFLRIFLPRLQPFLTNPTPNLLQQADAAPREGYYTKDTCIEFHHMLCNLLRLYQEKLAELDSQRGTTVTPEAIESCMTTILYCGEALLYISRGSAIEKHLQAIEPMLCTQSQGGADEGRAEGMHPKEEMTRDKPHDPELDSVQPGTTRDDDPVPLPLWKSHRDWLRLMVIHLDGVAIISDHVERSSHKNLSIEILAPPRVSKEMMPWEKLLRSDYFPRIPSDRNDFFNPTVDEIVEFLKSWSVPVKGSSNSPNAVIKSLRDLQKSVRALKPNKAIECIVEQLGSLKGCEMPGWADYTREMISEIEPLKDGCESPEAIICHILDKLQSLKNSSALFAKLNQDALLKGTGFDGTLHCELCLASFSCELTNKNYQAIVDEFAGTGSVIGVSKLCCPICQHALLLLKAKLKQHFLVRGSHGTISACTLPPWLPEDVVSDMITKFGTQLRKELLELMLRPPPMRYRARSTGSERLSVDSLEVKVRRPIAPRSG